jgi:hypothetical protein
MPKQLRLSLIIGAPLLASLLNLSHPVYLRMTGVYQGLHHHADWFVTLHVINLVLFALVGLAAYLLLQGQRGLAATIGRLALMVYVPFYSGFDALVGVGTGTLIRDASSLPASHLAIVEPLIDAYWSDGIAYALAATGSIAWSIAMLSASVTFTERARRRWAAPGAAIAFAVMGVAINVLGVGTMGWWLCAAGTGLLLFVLARPRLPAALLALSGALFGSTHVPPIGPLGLACFLIAALLCEAREPKPVAEAILAPQEA